LWGVDGDEQFLQLAVELARESANRDGGPFGALVVLEGAVVGRGTNRVTAEGDPTLHAEVVAIRDACERTGHHVLSGAVLYASCEPCPLCLASALWARIDRVYFAADRHGAAAAGFDDAVFYDYFAGTRPELLPVVQSGIPSSDAPFQAWGVFAGRKEY
jgi:guanine deaminase